MSCVFCEIIEGKIPSSSIYEDDSVFVIADINPQAPVHYLIIPRRHIASINDIHLPDDTQLMGHMIQTAKNLATKKSLSDNGYRLVFNVNDHGGQTVPHVHLHLLGGRRMHWPPG